ncbi:MAG: hypothetical protein WC344_00625 [Bacilli bacterium]|jgi:hypothetical protein
MKKIVVFLPLLLLALAACNPVTDSGSGSGSTSDSSPSLSSSSSEEVEYTESASWPASVISTFIGSASTAVAPSFTSPNPFYYAVLTDEDGSYLDILTEINATQSGDYFDVEVTYNSALTSAGFTIDSTDYADYGFFAYDASETLFIQYFWWDGFFSWYIWSA